MKIYLAGGVQANLKPMWSEACMRIRNGQNYETAVGDAMKIFLAGSWSRKWLYGEKVIAGSRPFILESFYYIDDTVSELIPYFGDFMLDSGAFTFMQGNHSGKINWDEYVEEYAEFIKKNKVTKYFELDIDSVVGYSEVLRLRQKLERITATKSIPVWHTARGKQEFVRMCEEYPYVAIGGLVGFGKSEYDKKYWKYFPWFIDTAHKNGSKIHALGFTSLEGINRYHFDSVDSTAWTTGNRFGYIFRFDGKTITKVDPPKGMHLGDTRKVAINNFVEWIKFQKYAETHL